MRLASFAAMALVACIAWDLTAASYVAVWLGGSLFMALYAIPLGLCAAAGLALSVFRPWRDVAALCAVAVCLCAPLISMLAVLALDCLLSTDCA
jgi:hypothetical protein